MITNEMLDITTSYVIVKNNVYSEEYKKIVLRWLNRRISDRSLRY